MYCLISDANYIEQFCIISNDIATLEELALSLFEEDWYEWFCIINQDKQELKSIREAFIHALEESDLYKIIEPVFIGD